MLGFATIGHRLVATVSRLSLQLDSRNCIDRTAETHGRSEAQQALSTTRRAGSPSASRYDTRSSPSRELIRTDRQGRLDKRERRLQHLVLKSGIRTVALRIEMTREALGILAISS
jgi:hypothetical protein